MTIVSVFYPLIIFAKRAILDVWQGSDCTTDYKQANCLQQYEKRYFGRCFSRNFSIFWEYFFQSTQWIAGFVDKLWLQREKEMKITVMLVNYDNLFFYVCEKAWWIPKKKVIFKIDVLKEYTKSYTNACEEFIFWQS